MQNYSNSVRLEKTRSPAFVNTNGRTSPSWTQTFPWSWSSNSSKCNGRSMICCHSCLCLEYRIRSISLTTKTPFFQPQGPINFNKRRKLATLAELLNFKKSPKWQFAHSADTSAAKIVCAKRGIFPDLNLTNKVICRGVQFAICAIARTCSDKCYSKKVTAFKK